MQDKRIGETRRTRYGMSWKESKRRRKRRVDKEGEGKETEVDSRYQNRVHEREERRE
jgi:hypothetical protein